MGGCCVMFGLVGVVPFGGLSVVPIPIPIAAMAHAVAA